MVALSKNFVLVTRFIRKLNGSSEPILAEASDGHLYVVKFTNNVLGPNTSFNDAMGTELYKACGLPVPGWRPLYVCDTFVDQNPACWLGGKDGLLGHERPRIGLAFGSRFLGGDGINLLDITAGINYRRIRNRMQLWTSWLVDACALHADGRQFVFRERADGLFDVVFIDHGNMFGGPFGGITPRPTFSRIWNPTIYPDLTEKDREKIVSRLKSFNPEKLWQRMTKLPEQWLSQMELNRFETAMDNLSSVKLVEDTLDLLTKAQQRWIEEREQHKGKTEDLFPALFPGFKFWWQQEGSGEAGGDFARHAA